MFDPQHLASLAAVLRLGSFDAAAAALSVTPSAISQRIRALEERVGTVLVERGQPARGTPAGLRIARHADALQLLESDLRRDLGLAGTTRSVLRLAVNADSLATWFLPALAEVPDMLWDLVIDDQDHSADWLRRGEVLAAVTGHATPVQGCDARPLGRLRYLATASPDFARRWFPDGVTQAALERAPALVFDRKDRMQADWAAQACGVTAPLPGHRLASSEGFVQATLLGLGWAMNPEVLVAGHLRAGRLVALRPDLPMEVPLVWQWTRLAAGPLAPLTRALRRAAAEVLLPP